MLEHLLRCTIWNDIGTYLASIDPIEKTKLKVAINYFKQVEKVEI